MCLKVFLSFFDVLRCFGSGAISRGSERAALGRVLRSENRLRNEAPGVSQRIELVTAERTSEHFHRSISHSHSLFILIRICYDLLELSIIILIKYY